MAQDVLRSLQRNVFRGRTGLRQWLFDHYDELQPALSGKRPPWSALALTAAEAGHKKAGKPFSRQTIREAWKSLEEQKKRSPSPEHAPILPLSSRRTVQPSPQTAADQSDETDDEFRTLTPPPARKR